MKTFAYCSYLICTSVQAYLGDYELAMSLLLVLFILDTATGIVKYFRLGNLRSKGIWYGTVSKIFMLLIPVLLDIMIAISIFAEYRAQIAAITITILVVAEFISMIQNIRVIRTGVEETEQDVITKVLNGILALLNILLENTLGKLQTLVKTETKIEKQ